MAGTLPKIVSYLRIVYATPSQKSIIFLKNIVAISFMHKNTVTFVSLQRLPYNLLLVAGLEPARGCPRGILSPLRLPIPPHQRMDGGGFEPPKQFAADLQSVPFGHSGIHP